MDVCCKYENQNLEAFVLTSSLYAKKIWSFNLVLVYFAGHVVGGKLKSLNEQDKESLEAGWFQPKEAMNSLDVRSTDIFPLIKIAMKWYESKKDNPLCRSLPVTIAHRKISVNLIMLKRQDQEEGSSFEILVVKASHNAIPTLPLHIANHVNYNVGIRKIIDDLVERAGPMQYKFHGYLQLEHDAKVYRGGADGLCLTALVEVTSQLEQLQDTYIWMPLVGASKPLSEKLHKLIDTEGYVQLMTFP